MATELNQNWVPVRPRRMLPALAVCAIVVLAALAAAGGTAAWFLKYDMASTPVAIEQPVAPRAVNLPHMQLQAQYSGPLMHTLIQRLRDPIDGTVCYLYLPIAVHHTAPTESGYVEYSGNDVGSLSCLERPAGVAEKRVAVPAP